MMISQGLAAMASLRSQGLAAMARSGLPSLAGRRPKTLVRTPAECSGVHL